MPDPSPEAAIEWSADPELIRELEIAAAVLEEPEEGPAIEVTPEQAWNELVESMARSRTLGVILAYDAAEVLLADHDKPVCPRCGVRYILDHTYCLAEVCDALQKRITELEAALERIDRGCLYVSRSWAKGAVVLGPPCGLCQSCIARTALHQDNPQEDA